MSKKALLFINGEIPNKIPNKLNIYSIIGCTDGAYSNYVKALKIPIDYISGDLDSININDISTDLKVIHTPDQNKTDFHKALELLIDQNITDVDIYGATGKETDHFIGNISTALFFKNKLNLKFYTDHSMFFFCDKLTNLHNVKGNIISLIPFFEAKEIITYGLKYPLNKENLLFGDRIGTRNVAEEDNVRITYSSGDLLIYIGYKK